MTEPLLVAKSKTQDIHLLPQLANRHGLITGATGTGKTITLQTVAEKLSALGVPVFMADVKGDLTGITQTGKLPDKVAAIVKERSLPLPTPTACPATLRDVYGEQGHPVRATVSDMGPLLLGRMLALNETQSGVLNLVFKIADDSGLALLDMKDLRAMLQYVGDNASQFTTEYVNDYWGNEVYGLDLASGTWTLVKAASGLGPTGVPSEPMPDGNPVSRHTYDGLAYLRHLGQVFMFGGATSPNAYSVNNAWAFVTASGAWRARAAAPSTGAGHYYMASAYATVTRKVYVRNQHGFYTYDPDADRWSGAIVSFNHPPYYPRLQTHHYRRAVVLPAQRLLLVGGGKLANPPAPDVFIYDLDGRGDVTAAYPMSGDTSVISTAGLGLDVDTRTGSLVAWAGGAPAIKDTATWHWRRGSARGAPAQAVPAGFPGHLPHRCPRAYASAPSGSRS